MLTSETSMTDKQMHKHTHFPDIPADSKSTVKLINGAVWVVKRHLQLVEVHQLILHISHCMSCITIYTQHSMYKSQENKKKQWTDFNHSFTVTPPFLKSVATVSCEFAIFNSPTFTASQSVLKIIYLQQVTTTSVIFLILHLRQLIDNIT